MKLVTVNISIPDKIANYLTSKSKINYLCDNIQEYIEQAIEELRKDKTCKKAYEKRNKKLKELSLNYKGLKVTFE